MRLHALESSSGELSSAVSAAASLRVRILAAVCDQVTLEGKRR